MEGKPDRRPVAKKGAPDFPTDAAIDKVIKRAYGATQQAAALLGAVTHASKNKTVTKTKADGSTYEAVVRDCSDLNKLKAKKAVPAAAAPKSPPPPQPEIEVTSGSEQGTPRRTRAARARAAAAADRKAQEVACTANAIVNAATTSRSSGAAPACERLAAVKRRLAERLAGGSSELAEEEGEVGAPAQPESPVFWGTFAVLTSEAA